MNITNALRRIAILKGEIARWDTRLSQSIIYRETAVPAYPTAECFETLSKLTTEMLDLRQRVAIANATHTITIDDESFTLAGTILTMAEVKSRLAVLNRLACQATATVTLKETSYIGGVAAQTEYTQCCDLVTRERDTRVSQLEESFQKMNALLEAANHTTKI